MKLENRNNFSTTIRFLISTQQAYSTGNVKVRKIFLYQ